MVDDDDIFELTEEMASVPPDSATEEGGDGAEVNDQEPEGRDSLAPPRPSSPFTMVADPTPRESTPVPDPELELDPPPRPSYIPEASSNPVLAIPIHNLGRDSSLPPPPVTEDVDESLDDAIRDAYDQSTLIEEEPEDEAIFDLGQDMMVESEVEQGEELQAVAIAPASPEPVPSEPTPPEPAAAESVPSESEEPEKVDAPGEIENPETAIAGDEDQQDLGTPEAVFDTLPEEEAPSEEVEIDLDDPGDKPPEDSETPPQGEEEEELDLADAVEMTAEVARPSTPGGPAAAHVPRGRAPRMRRRKRRKKEWWADIFDDDYLSLLPTPGARDTRREVDFIEKNLSPPGTGLVLDLACGNGRHAVGMARRGYRIVGVDLSLPMLARAGEVAQEADQKINFIHGDMRDLGFDRTFDGVYCVGTSFGYFDDVTNIKVFEGVARALKPGARFLLEVANRDNAIYDQPNLTWFEGNGSVCMEETNFNYINSRLYVTRQLIMGESGRQVRHELSIRLYSLHELGTMLHKAGFIVSQVAGHTATPGAFFGADSAQIIIVASRRK